MPTKPNRAGNQQNYVPAGNGDASGEYGDNATGSNIHFKVFKKPARTSELSKKQIKEIGNYVRGRDFEDEEKLNRLLRTLRYYDGSFGDLTNFSDDDLKEIVNELGNTRLSTDIVWYKDGSKWKGTHNVGLLEKIGVEYFTAEEKDKKIKEANAKLVEKSQNEQDRTIQKIMGDNCVVCFGKGYSKDDLEQVVKDTETYTKDFPELKDNIRLMGDRNNLEKYYNALQDLQEPTEEEIAAKINQIKKFTLFYGAQGEELEKKYRDEAIKRLKQPLKLSRINRAYAYWSPSEKAMIYMGKMKSFDGTQSQRNFDINWHSSNKTNGVYCHEMGHAVDYALAQKYEKVYNKLKNGYTDGYSQDNVDNYNKLSKLQSEYQNFRNKINELSNQNFSSEYKEKFNALFKEKTGLDYGSMNYSREKYEAENEVKKELQEQGIRKYALSEYGTTNIKEFVAESFSAYYTDMKNPLANQVVEAFKDFSKKLREYE